MTASESPPGRASRGAGELEAAAPKLTSEFIEYPATAPERALRSLREGPPLRPGLSPMDADCAQACNRQGYPFPPGWCDFSGYSRQARHWYGLAQRWWEDLSTRDAAAAVIRHPDDIAARRGFSDAIDAASRKRNAARQARVASALNSANTLQDSLLRTYIHGDGASTGSRTSTRLAADLEAVSILENVARTVRAADGRRNLPASEWADRCGVPTARLSKVLTDYAEYCGWTVRRYRIGHDKMNMIEIAV